MSFVRKTQLTPSEKLDMVLPQYKKVSEMGEDPEAEKGKLYKAINDQTNMVYLITNPITWQERHNENGTITRIRPAQKVMGHLDDLKRTTINVTPVQSADDYQW